MFSINSPPPSSRRALAHPVTGAGDLEHGKCTRKRTQLSRVTQAASMYHALVAMVASIPLA
jgi:hypothetical protein